MLKRISPKDPIYPPITRPAAVVATTSAQPQPSSVPLAQQELNVAIDSLEANLEPPIATETKKKKKKKSKKNQCFCVFFLFFLLSIFSLFLFLLEYFRFVVLLFICCLISFGLMDNIQFSLFLCCLAFDPFMTKKGRIASIFNFCIVIVFTCLGAKG